MNEFERFSGPAGDTLISITRDGAISQTCGKLPIRRYHSRITLNTAQILTLNSAPVLVVPGVPGYIIDAKAFYMRYNYGGVIFNPNVNDDFVFYIGQTPYISQNPSPVTGFVDQTVSMSVWMKGWWYNDGANLVTQTATPVSNISGSGLYFTQYRSNTAFPNGADWTQGNGNMIVFTEYQLIPA